jgi:hypothetical protein
MNMKSIEELLTIRYEKRAIPLEAEKSKPCPRCNGSGKLMEYGYYKHGKCFACNGTGRA